MTTEADGAMWEWFTARIVDTGRLPLFFFFAGIVVGFLFIRVSVRLIRANVRWWPGNITPGGLHVHHMVFGVVFMVAGGVAGLALPDELLAWRTGAAALFGVGTALVLDEFALILHLEDVYWSEQGRVSVDALFAVVAITGMLLLGLHPFLIGEVELVDDQDRPLPGYWAAIPLALAIALAVITVLKGKIWTGLLGIFVLVPLFFGAVRLARPMSPWARWRYRADHPRGARKLARAHRRERRLHRPVNEFKNHLQDLIAGRPHR